MEDFVAYIIQRFPGRDSEIRELMKSDARAQDLARRHYELHRRLEALDPADNPQRLQQLESELQAVEREVKNLL